MQVIFFKDLNFPAKQVIEELSQVYAQLCKSAIKENDLWSYASADMTLATLKTASNMILQPECYYIESCYFRSEPSDSVESLMEKRMHYVYNAPSAP